MGLELLSFSMWKPLSYDCQEILKKELITSKEWRTPKFGDIATIAYSAKLGEHDESSFLSNENIEIKVEDEDEGTYPEGFMSVLTHIKKGERLLTRIPSHLAYGTAGSSSLNVPPDSTIYYDITLKGFRPAFRVGQAVKIDEKEAKAAASTAASTPATDGATPISTATDTTATDTTATVTTDTTATDTTATDTTATDTTATDTTDTTANATTDPSATATASSKPVIKKRMKSKLSPFAQPFTPNAAATDKTDSITSKQSTDTIATHTVADATDTIATENTTTDTVSATDTIAATDITAAATDTTSSTTSTAAEDVAATTTTATVTEATTSPATSTKKVSKKKKELTKEEKEALKESTYGKIIEVYSDGKVKVLFRNGEERTVEGSILAVRQNWDMTTQERLEYANQMKEDGNNKYSEKKFVRAIKYYKVGEATVDGEYGLSAEEKLLFRQKKAAIRCNIALMFLKLKKYFECVLMCTKVLKENPDNTKARRRRANAKYEGQLGDLDEMKEDFEMVVKDNPKDTSSQKRLEYVKKKIKKRQKEERKKYKGMFDSKPKVNKKKSKEN